MRLTTRAPFTTLFRYGARFEPSTSVWYSIGCVLITKQDDTCAHHQVGEFCTWTGFFPVRWPALRNPSREKRVGQETVIIRTVEDELRGLRVADVLVRVPVIF